MTFTDEELDALREAAGQAGVSLRTFAHDAIVRAAGDRKRAVAAMAREVAERSAELNERLA